MELKQMQQEMRQKDEPGRLKIYFGYAGGVGKTYAMLRAARSAAAAGTDTVVGCLGPGMHPETLRLLDGLELLCPAAGAPRPELDLDAALARHPALLCVDELARVNPEGSRNRNRYQDVRELLHAGIDVAATLDVRDIESLADAVAAITGRSAGPRVPDVVFDGADQVQMVDLEPQELLARQGGAAREALPSVQDLTALREIALRRCADRINTLAAEDAWQRGGARPHAEEHILVCLSASPDNPRIIRAAARMAQAFHGGFTALFVETPEFGALGEEERQRLRQNMHLAQRLGASIEAAYGSDIAQQIAEFARLSGATKIVLGRDNASRRSPLRRPALTDRLSSCAPDLEIYIIPGPRPERSRPPRAQKFLGAFTLSDFLRTIAVLTAASLIGFVFLHLGFSEANIVTVYLLGVLVTAVVTTARAASISAAIASVLVFNFFFTEPRYTLHAYDPRYLVTFVVMFAAALITSNLTVRIKEQAKQAVQSAYRTKVLLEADQALQRAGSSAEIAAITIDQLQRLLGRSVVFYPADKGEPGAPVLPPDCPDTAPLLAPAERAAAAWALANNRRAGAGTDTLTDAHGLYLAVRLENKVYGVVGVDMARGPLELSENSIVLAILGECAMALEKEKIAAEKEQAAIHAKNEQLRANLLRAISHDLRTPLTSISGSAGVLLENGEAIAPDKKRKLYEDIYDDSQWLISLVENLLSVTRIEDGTMKLRPVPELMDEAIAEALRHVGRRGGEHCIRVAAADDLVLVRMDAHLIVQVLINLIDNAVKYTPPGAQITISTAAAGSFLATEVADNGPGIADADKAHIFDMFYTCGTGVVDSRRSLGLGLALCRSIISAHGGEITVRDNVPCGTIFRFTLPIDEVTLHE